MGAFNELALTTELWMFGIPLVAVLFGLLELMMRDMAGIKWEPKNPIPALTRAPASSPQEQSPPLQPAPEDSSKTTTAPDKPENLMVRARIHA